MAQQQNSAFFPGYSTGGRMFTATSAAGAGPTRLHTYGASAAAKISADAGGVMSIGRVTATTFPLFLALALLVPRRHVVAWVAVFAMLQALAAALFFTWRPMV